MELKFLIRVQDITIRMQRQEIYLSEESYSLWMCVCTQRQMEVPYWMYNYSKISVKMDFYRNSNGYILLYFRLHRLIPSFEKREGVDYIIITYCMQQ
jgi:hypothetical protein